MFNANKEANLFLKEVEKAIRLKNKGDISMNRKELGSSIEINFYDFSKFEYYALVVAENMENAIKGYKEVVADIEDEDLEPNIITKKEALEKYKKGEIEGCETIQEKVQDFYKGVNDFRNPSTNGGDEFLVLLIDGSLL